MQRFHQFLRKDLLDIDGLKMGKIIFHSLQTSLFTFLLLEIFSHLTEYFVTIGGGRGEKDVTCAFKRIHASPLSVKGAMQTRE